MAEAEGVAQFAATVVRPGCLIGGEATFGSAWVMSPALWYADGAIFR